MKLIIDVPEYVYERIREYYEKNDTVESTYSYIYHGTPIPDNATNDVLEQIRAEIKDEMDDIASGCLVRNGNDGGYYSGLWWALKIIDKYTK